MTKNLLLIALGLLILLSGCAQLTATPTGATPELSFEPKLSMYEAGKVHFEFGIANEAGSDQPMVDDVNIRAVVTNEEGEIRNQMTIVDLSPISAGETAFPLIYEAVYDPGQYEMSISGEGIPSLSLNFEIREEDNVLKLAAHPDYIDPHTGFTIDEPGQ